MINNKRLSLKTPQNTEERSLNNNSPQHIDEESQQSSEQDTSSISEYGFKLDKVVVLNNQFETFHLQPLVNDVESEDEENQHDNLLVEEEEENQQMNERDKILYNYRVINQMINKVQKDKQALDKRLKSVKENNYNTTISWNQDEKLHKEANLAVLESERDTIVLKKKKLERLRRDILNVKNLQDQIDPELYLQIKTINFNKGQINHIKDFFSTIDLMVNKNSLIGFNWEKFCERTFKNKDTIDAFLYKLKYFPFNEMSDYYYALCKKYSEEELPFLNIFVQKGNAKIPYEIFIVKPFIEWMKIMKYGYELNLELIESIKRTNTESIEVEKLQLTTDIIQIRSNYQNEQLSTLEEQTQQISKLLQQLQNLKQSYKIKYNLQDI